MILEHDIELRVRYPEVDQGGNVHHANYFVWFEMGRTELLRASGVAYRELERQGLFIVVVRAECRYLRPARYDDLLRLNTRVTRVTSARIEHDYRLFRQADNEPLAEAHIVLCCVDASGAPQRLPEWMQVGRTVDPGEGTPPGGG